LRRASRQTKHGENFAQFRFNFNNPGARATGIGSALHVDLRTMPPTSEANPAGLTALLRPELSLEAKGIQFTTHVGIFPQIGTDANFSLVEKDFKSAVVSPSFVSVVYPCGVHVLRCTGRAHELSEQLLHRGEPRSGIYRREILLPCEIQHPYSCRQLRRDYRVQVQGISLVGVRGESHS